MRNMALRWLMPLVGGAAALTMIFWLYGSLDFGVFFAGLGSADPFWIAVLAAAILLEQLMSGWKWRQLLYDVKPISTLRLTGALFAGYGVNVLVPLGVSPLIRAWLVARLEALKVSTVLTTTIIARFIDGVVFAIFAGAVAMAGKVPQIEGNLELGLSVAGALNIFIFGGLLWIMFRFRAHFSREGPIICRLFDWVAARMRVHGTGLRKGLCEGVVWPQARSRRIAVIVAAIMSKLIAKSHFVWSGLAVGVVLRPWDYLFLMVFAGFVMVLGRFVRIPGSFVFGAGFALHALDVPDETALLMILFNYIITVILIAGLGLLVLWQSGIDIRRARFEAEAANARP